MIGAAEATHLTKTIWLTSPCVLKLVKIRCKSPNFSNSNALSTFASHTKKLWDWHCLLWLRLSFCGICATSSSARNGVVRQPTPRLKHEGKKTDLRHSNGCLSGRFRHITKQITLTWCGVPPWMRYKQDPLESFTHQVVSPKTVTTEIV